jgi:hypothetical protein
VAEMNLKKLPRAYSNKEESKLIRGINRFSSSDFE